MARVYKNPSLVSGLSVQDILNMDIETFNKLNLSDLRKIVGRLVSAGNKRIRTFEKANEPTPATNYIFKSGGWLSTKGKDLNGLRTEYVRAKNFLQAETSTQKGWKQLKTEVIRGLKKHGINITEKQYNDLWRAYEELKTFSPEVANRGLKYSVLKEAANMLIETDQQPTQIAMAIKNQLAKIYEEQAALNNANGVSNFFEIE